MLGLGNQFKWATSRLMPGIHTMHTLSQAAITGSTKPFNRFLSDEGDGSIKFARFVNGTLVLFKSRPEELEYVAFSHVWGDWKWLKMPDIPYEVKASQEKSDFIEKELPALVGNVAFWMYTLTVDQRDEKAVLAIVQSVSAIFKNAQLTIAVRESDGLYECCMRAVGGFRDYADFSDKLIKHGTHDQYIYNESYLQRLWTL